MLKTLQRWFFGKPRKKDNKQHAFRQPGEVVSDEENQVSYEPGWWQTTGMPFSKTALWIVLAVCVGLGVIVGGIRGMHLADKQDDKIEAEKEANLAKIEAEKEANLAKIKAEKKANVEKAQAEKKLTNAKTQRERAEADKKAAEAANTRANGPCVDFIKIVKENKDGTASVKCTHTRQVMTTSWEGGRFIVTCKCPPGED